MRKLILLIPFFLFACKKEEQDKRIAVRQQPSAISVFSVDTATGLSTLQYDIRYFYNDAAERFDSIAVAGKTYRFDYSKISTDNTVLLNYTGDDQPYEEMIFDVNFFRLTQYNEVRSPGVKVRNTLQFDSNNRMTDYTYSNTPADDNFSRNYTYRNDSIFVRTQRPFDACETNDTIIQTFYEMNTKLPYGLFTNLTEDCGSVGLNILRALPVSNYTNRLPFRVLSGVTETSYTYKGDSESRLGEALLTIRWRNSNQLKQKLKIAVTY